MRKTACLIIALLLIFTCAVGVSAATGASGVASHSTVDRDGSCQVTLTATVHLDEVREDLEFPLPAQAASVTVNGSRVRTVKSGSRRVIDLDKVIGKVAGDFSLSIHFRLPDVVHTTGENTLQLQVPLLSGFAYPIEDMEFSVTLPGEPEGLPAFESGYHQANIERDITYDISGATISGTFTQALKDHETVTMYLAVDEQMFPQTLADTQDFGFALIAMGVCAGLAAVYWLLALRRWPFRKERSPQPPDGLTAGELGCVLNMRGVQMQLTVLTWATLGYILIHDDRHGRVVLYKRMDMGNERKEAERQLFKKLFGKSDKVDTGSARYAALTRQAEQKPMAVRELLHPRCGSGKVFRALAAGMGLFGGVGIAVAMSGGAVLQGLLILLLGALGALTGWHLQSWGGWLLTPDRYRLVKHALVCAAWLLLGLAAGAFHVAGWMVAGLLAAGLLLNWGFRMTDTGRQTAARVLGLRQYMATADKLLLQRLQGSDPDYFFDMAPYALALGVGKPFARRFGKKRLSGCPYLTTGMDAHMTAYEWMGKIQAVTEKMDARSRSLPVEKTVKRIRSLIK